jgi:uncharacterized protein (DUF1697 family)
LCAMKNTPRTTSASISTFVALLRGINLSGHRIVKMDQLRKAFEDLGFEDVKTYIQSGNVVFRAPQRTSQDLAKRIEQKVLREFGFPVPVVVKTAGEIGEVIRDNPLLKEKGIDPSKLHVTFLSCSPDKSALKMLDGVAAAPDQFRCFGQAVYLHCPNGYHESKLTNNVLEKMLKVGTTTRNWKTVNKLREMARN